MANKIEVITDNYEEMYGTKPRGMGMWAFFVTTMRGTDFDEPIIVSGTYSQAKAQAIREAKSTVGGVVALILGT